MTLKQEKAVKAFQEACSKLIKVLNDKSDKELTLHVRIVKCSYYSAGLFGWYESHIGEELEVRLIRFMGKAAFEPLINYPGRYITPSDCVIV